jgi:chromosome segregation ATPase
MADEPTVRGSEHEPREDPGGVAGLGGNGASAEDAPDIDPQWLTLLRARVDIAERERDRVRGVLDSANAARARSLDALQAARQESAELRAALDGEIKRLRESLEEANDDRARLRSAREAWLQEREKFKDTIDAAHAALEQSLADQEELRRTLEASDYWLRSLERSRSWRLTRPLRAAISGLRRLGGARTDRGLPRA